MTLRDWIVASDALPIIVIVMKGVLYTVVVLILVYTARHVLFTLNRLFAHQRHPYLDVDVASWPTVTVVVPCHNEEAVVAHVLEALVEVDYPPDRLRIMPVDDRSIDRTWDLITAFSANHPDLIVPVKRTSGMPGKAAVLKDVSATLDSAVLIVFDADYVPGRGLIKQLVAPFFDAEVGAVMGRVVPHNVDRNLLTRLLDLERAGGYQVDQQARMNLHLIAQYGGSVGGVRLSALHAVGGWRETALAEDTDLTFRLVLHGYKVAYENRCECYEEVPEVWQERNRQIMRWAKGHNQVARRYAWATLWSRRLSLAERIDGILLLGVYVLAPVLIAGFLAAFGLYMLGVPALGTSTTTLIGMVAFSSLGNYAAFFEIAAAMHLDNSRRRLRLLPLNFVNFLSSVLNVTRACFSALFLDTLLSRSLHWEKTPRYRRNGNGP